VVWTERGRKPVSEFSTADVQLADTLETLEDKTNYTAWIFELVAPYLGARVLEVGAGHGTITARLAQEGRQVVATDLSARCVRILEEKFAAEPNVEILTGSIDVAAAGGPYDTAVLVNVLEHIEDDQQALHQLASLLAPGGRLILWVPAFNFLYSDFDRKIGHFRRYRIRDLRQKLSQAGLEANDVRYVNPIGAAGWFLLARVLRRDPVSGRPVDLLDRYLVPVLKVLDRHVRPPFGQSLFVASARSAHFGK